MARRAAALREAEKQLGAAEAGQTVKESQLTAAKEAQVCVCWCCWWGSGVDECMHCA